MRRDGLPCLRGEVLDHARDALRQFVVDRGQVEFVVQRLAGVEVVAQAADLVVDASVGVQLGDVWAVYFVPGEGLHRQYTLH